MISKEIKEQLSILGDEMHSDAEGKSQEVIKLCESINRSEWDYEVYGLYAAALYNSGKYDEAIDVLENEPKAIDKDDEIYLYRLLYAYNLRRNDDDLQNVLNLSQHILENFSDKLDDDRLYYVKHVRYEALEATEPAKAVKFAEEAEFTGYALYYDEDELNTVKSHIEENFGVIDSFLQESINYGVACDIAFIKPNEKSSKIRICTIGAGALDMPGMSDEYIAEYGGRKRAEVLFELPSGWDIESFDEEDFWPMGWLKIIARLPYKYNSFLGVGHTVPAGEPIANTKFECFMLVSPLYDEASEFCTLPNGQEVGVLQMIPLFKEEMDYKIDHGFDALLERLMALGDDENEEVVALRFDRPNTCEGYIAADDEFFVLDKYNYEWDDAEIQPLCDDEMCFYNRMAYFLRFCFENELLEDRVWDMLNSWLANSKDYREFIHENLGGELNQSMLKKAGYLFAREYYRNNIDVSYVPFYRELVKEYFKNKEKGDIDGMIKNLVKSKGSSDRQEVYDMPYDEKIYEDYIEPELEYRFGEFTKRLNSELDQGQDER